MPGQTWGALLHQYLNHFFVCFKSVLFIVAKVILGRILGRILDGFSDGFCGGFS